jgi:hypothetical protein
MSIITERFELVDKLTSKFISEHNNPLEAALITREEYNEICKFLTQPAGLLQVKIPLAEVKEAVTAAEYRHDETIPLCVFIPLGKNKISDIEWALDVMLKVRKATEGMK